MIRDREHSSFIRNNAFSSRRSFRSPFFCCAISCVFLCAVGASSDCVIIVIRLLPEFHRSWTPAIWSRITWIITQFRKYYSNRRSKRPQHRWIIHFTRVMRSADDSCILWNLLKHNLSSLSIHKNGDERECDFNFCYRINYERMRSPRIMIIGFTTLNTTIITNRYIFRFGAARSWKTTRQLNYEKLCVPARCFFKFLVRRWDHGVTRLGLAKWFTQLNSRRVFDKFSLYPQQTSSLINRWNINMLPLQTIRTGTCLTFYSIEISALMFGSQ